MTSMHPDPQLAGDLLRGALTPRSTPIADPAYRAALEAYFGDPRMQDMVRSMALGLGLRVVEAGPRGLVVAPLADSLFAFPGASFRSGANTANERTTDALFLLAIAAATYPRSADLNEDPGVARPPITVDQVELLLRDAVARHAQAAPPGDQPAAAQVEGLEPVWKHLDRIPDVRDTADGRAGARTSRQKIRRLLDRLTDLGAFTTTTVHGAEAWQPSYRWQVQVQEVAATSIWEEVRQVLLAQEAP